MEKSAFIPLSVPNFGGNERKYVNEAVVSEWVSTGGSMVGAFEDAFAGMCGMPGAVACASGTAALHLALLVAGAGAGDEVIAPDLTFIAAVNPIRYVGAEPVLVGCDDSLCIDPEAVADFCEKRCETRGGVLYNKTGGRPVRALLVVHVFGNMADMEKLCAIAEKYNLTLIEDATEAIGTVYTEGPFAGRMAGAIGDIGAYSFNGNKIITTGAGGMLVAKNGAWFKRAKHLSTQAKSDEVRYTHDEIGYNYRMTNLQAALGLAQLEQLDGFIARKHALYAQYSARLDGHKGLRILPFRAGVRSNRWFFSLFLEKAAITREALMAALSQDGIQTRPIWGLVHCQKPYLANAVFAAEKAEYYQDRVLNLPCSTGLSAEDAQRVCDRILAYCG
jgi:aminotransferase in exopolysaccharide biosynthesis